MIVDFATSFFAGGKLSVGMARGEQLPEGALIDHEGNPSTDPAVYWTKPRGYLLPFGGMVGYKGYGLCMVADILGGAHSQCPHRIPLLARTDQWFIDCSVGLKMVT